MKFARGFICKNITMGKRQVVPEYRIGPIYNERVKYANLEFSGMYVRQVASEKLRPRPVLQRRHKFKS